MAAPFRFGVTLFPTSSRRQDWIREVKRAEACGVSAVTVIDHFGTSGGIFSSLVVAADVAPELRVGTLVVNNDLWNPAVLAREAITADVLTDGRFELGIGAGWNDDDYRAAGLVRAGGAERVAKLAESVEILRQAFAGGPVSFDGRFYCVESGTWPASAQTPIPLLIGGGSRHILELAGRKADIVSIHRRLERGSAASWSQAVISADGTNPVTEKVGWVRAAAGARFDQLQFHALIQRCVVTSEREKVAADLGAPLGLRGEDVLSSPHFLIGSVDEMAADITARRESWGINYWTLVGSADIDAYGAVIERVVAK